jgi:hypothetical protein
VRVHVPQTGDQVLASRVNSSHALRNERALFARADGRYPVAAENYCLIVPYDAMLDVNDGDMNERKSRLY